MGSIFFGGPECFGHSFVYVAYFVFLGDVLIRTQRAALATHLPQKRQCWIKYKNQTEVHGIMKWNCATSFPISTLMYEYLGAFYMFPPSVLFGISIFLYFVREFSAQPQERREGQGTASKQQLVAVPCPPLRSFGWAKSSQKWPTWKIMDHKWKQLILVVKFLI